MIVGRRAEVDTDGAYAAAVMEVAAQQGTIAAANINDAAVVFEAGKDGAIVAKPAVHEIKITMDPIPDTRGERGIVDDLGLVQAGTHHGIIGHPDCQ